MATRYPRDRVASGTMRNGYAFMIICTLLVLLYLVDILRKAFRVIFRETMKTHELYLWMYVLGGIVYNYTAFRAALKKPSYRRLKFQFGVYAMISSLYVVMAGMVIMSTINEVEAFRLYFENGQTLNSPSYGSMTDFQLYQKSQDYNRLTEDQKPVAYQLYKGMHQELGKMSDDSTEFLNIYEIAYMLIIWGCIGLLTLVNMTIAVFEGARLYRSQRRYRDDQLIDHLLQTWDYNNEPISPFSECLHSQVDQELALDLPPSYAEVCPDRNSKIETENSENSDASENSYDEIPSDSSGSEQIGTSFLSTRGGSIVRNPTV